jgi:hypothetical protein
LTPPGMSSSSSSAPLRSACAVWQQPIPSRNPALRSTAMWTTNPAANQRCPVLRSIDLAGPIADARPTHHSSLSVCPIITNNWLHCHRSTGQTKGDTVRLDLYAFVVPTKCGFQGANNAIWYGRGEHTLRPFF